MTETPSTTGSAPSDTDTGAGGGSRSKAHWGRHRDWGRRPERPRLPLRGKR
jgi:hypothetical protein